MLVLTGGAIKVLIHNLKEGKIEDRSLYLDLTFKDEEERAKFLAAQESNLQVSQDVEEEVLQADKQKIPMQPLASHEKVRAPIKTQERVTSHGDIQRISAAHQTNIAPGKGLAASALANKYNDRFMTGDKEAYHFGFARPVENARGELNLKFPNEDAKNDFLIGLAEDNMAFVAYDDNTGEAIAVSKGDGEILFKGEPGFDEALPKQEDLQAYGDAVDRAHQDSAGDRGPTQEDEQEDIAPPTSP